MPPKTQSNRQQALTPAPTTRTRARTSAAKSPAVAASAAEEPALPAAAGRASRKPAAAKPAVPEMAKAAAPAPAVRRSRAKPRASQVEVDQGLVAAKPARRSRRVEEDKSTTAAVRAPEAPRPATPNVHIRALDEGAIFGRYAVELPDEEAAEVSLRSSSAGTALCSCLDFALSEDARCAHVQAVLGQLQADPGRAAAFAAGPQAASSRIGLRHAAARRLLWLPGAECPPALDQLAQQLLGADVADDQALPRLLQLAQELGHELQVDEAVWAQLALQRDARWRVHRLEALLPQGPASAVLQNLRPEPLLPLQLEAALFAVCAGRCILADDEVLQPMQQALAAAALWRRHFGLQQVLVLAPGEALEGWRRQLPAGDGGWSLLSLDHLAGDAALHRQLAPELVIVQEPAEGGLWVDAERAAALLRLPAAQAIVLPAPGWLDRAAEWPLRLAFVDAARCGAYAALLQRHGVRDGDGQLCGLQGLDRVRETLEAVLLLRRRDEVLAQLPERVQRVRRVSLPVPLRERHSALLAAALLTLQRWRAVGWWPDTVQRQLVAQVQALRRLCAGVDAPELSAVQAATMLALLNDANAPVAKLVVFSQWPQALLALQPQLAAAGVAARLCLASQGQAQCRAAVQALQSDPDLRVLLVDDAGAVALDLQRTDVQLLHLDGPWHPRGLDRRFRRVHRRGTAHLVPVTQLLVEDSFAAGLHGLHGLHARMAERAEPALELLDANAADGFVQGAALAQWLSDLAALLDPAAAAAGAPA